VVSDVAFLVMDLLDRRRPDLACAFLDGWLDGSGDYEGLRLLRFFQGYRAGVRAKVAALRFDGMDGDDPDRNGVEATFRRHLAGTDAAPARPPGTLVLLCGLSGSGKSVLARELVPRLGALRLRTDVARRGPELATDRAGGDGNGPGSGASVDEGRYAPAARAAVYDRLARLARDLLAAGETVLIDGTFLTRAQRRTFLVAAGAGAGRRVVLHCTAAPRVLRERVRRRSEAGGDASEADEAVLRKQFGTLEAPRTGEGPAAARAEVFAVATDGDGSTAALAAAVVRALGREPRTPAGDPSRP
jgi:predicted kinase